MGAMANANEILGFLHGFYGAGATIAPLVATTMITKAGLPWYTWYYVMVSIVYRAKYGLMAKQLVDRGSSVRAGYERMELLGPHCCEVS